MGIPGLERVLRQDCVKDVSIVDLVKKTGKNEIVVDGFNFYGLYLYPKFDWVCGGLQELVQEVRKFVEAFERIGVKLVFFFVEGHLDEGMDKCGSEKWVKRHTDFIKYTTKFFDLLSRFKPLSHVIKERDYYYTPLHALSVVIFALRHILHCKVFMTYSGDRCDAVAYYTRSNNCLALLAQDNYYVFYQGIPCYLSLNSLKLETLTTIQYIPEALAAKKDLEDLLYPVFILYADDLKPVETKILAKICRKLDECENADIARKKIMKCVQSKNILDILDAGNKNIVVRPTFLTVILFQELLRYNFGFEYLEVHGPVTKWELIKLRAQELYTSGKMSVRIGKILMSKVYYNDCILEDFIDLPPSSLIYRPLRQKLYGVLFHEAPDSNAINAEINEMHSQVEDGDSSDADNDYLKPGAMNIWKKKLYAVYEEEEVHDGRVIFEWVVTKNGGFKDSVPFSPPMADPGLHPGLLALWNFTSNTSDVTNTKWQLFTRCISPGLDCENLSKLSPTLVVPTVVLNYLYNDVPQMFKSERWKFLQPWEVEVFIAQVVMLPRTNPDFLSKMTIQNVKPRIVQLNALFVHGCHTVRLLVEACGYPISEYDLSLSHFSDGKLLHSFYEKAEWRHTAEHLCDKDSLATFQQMKQIILPDSSVRSRRT